jgi:glutamyl-tRNA reductase
VSHLVVGLSHHSAPLELLERSLLDHPAAEKLLRDLLGTGPVSEAAAVVTCNRLEVLAEVDRFHAGVEAICDRLAMHTGVGQDELRAHLYVHYEERAVRHVFTVAAGLDSMVVGETQILGQVRSALRVAQEAGTVARSLHEVLRQAIHVGKRVHAETDLSRAGRSLVDLGLEAAENTLGGLAGRSALVVGAGTMSSIAARALRQGDVARLSIVNRSVDRASRLAAAVGAEVLPATELGAAIGTADLVVSCTASTRYVLTTDVVAAAMATRAGRPLTLIDLAVPRDVEPDAAELAGVHLITLERLMSATSERVPTDAVTAAREIVAEEVVTFLGALRAARVAPTVVALRSMAADVVSAELTRLRGRLPELQPAELDEIQTTVRRVVDKLLHAPTVRVKDLADDEGPDYERALRHLFALDRRAVEAMTGYDLESETRS